MTSCNVHLPRTDRPEARNRNVRFPHDAAEMLWRSKTKLGFIILANSLMSLSTNRHLSIPMKTDSERCGTSFDEGDGDPNGGEAWRAPKSRARLSVLIPSRD